MEYDLQLDEGRNLVCVRIKGRCSFMDFGRFFVRLLDLKAAPDLRILTDIRTAELTEGSFKGVSVVEEKADRFVDAYLPVRQAILVNSVLNFGIARMYETLAEKDGYAVAVFNDRRDAIEWLNACEGESA